MDTVSAGSAESALLGAARRGDEDAFAALWRTVERTLFGLCLHVTGDRADALDALQDTQIAIWRHLRAHRGTGSFAGWAHVIARNAARDLVRRRVRDRETSLSAVGEAGYARPFDDVVADLVDVSRGLAGLPGPHREALLLWAGGLTYEQVATMMDTTPATVRGWIHRARQRLRHPEPPR